MRRSRLCNIVFACLLSVAAWGQNDSILVSVEPQFTDSQTIKPQPAKEKKQVYYGTQVKLDILSPVLMAGLYNWQIQHYEVAVNVRLAKRFYPTLELGYSGGSTTQGDTISYSGYGGFFRVGADICPLKKHPDSPHALLVGLRFGTAVQECGQVYADGEATKIGVRGDCWGEIVAGCQVEIAQVNNTAFYMGWMGRFKILFTRKGDTVYIPGFGKKDDMGWGADYYLGWRF